MPRCDRPSANDLYVPLARLGAVPSFSEGARPPGFTTVGQLLGPPPRLVQRLLNAEAVRRRTGI
jgi:hypothetical protein